MTNKEFVRSICPKASAQKRYDRDLVYYFIGDIEELDYWWKIPYCRGRASTEEESWGIIANLIRKLTLEKLEL